MTVPRRRPPSRIETPPHAPSTSQRLIWDGDRQAFNVGCLREAMLIRDLTVEALATAANVSSATVYNCLRGRRTHLRTARLILEALRRVQPSLRLGDLT